MVKSVATLWLRPLSHLMMKHHVPAGTAAQNRLHGSTSRAGQAP